ncbi:uncharacterized protein LOC110457690 [Mizuhopecten yessoensis]|uniref:SH3 domain-containing protein n=1 Tax=Mizuhopecten yessoensis TaxID=6573 RepID=A0A210Q862_MIZYE|nr:uncharacterized protein LOC110457690 [Mizuhopecten yessoensis]XP_021364726.1 uncharacterized protein LOC110457690 [Mizuhopecten yessoensis]OWF44928.1 hypothetical protein KP79_PYT16508 [Mizuhopecten yessoensis]
MSSASESRDSQSSGTAPKIVPLGYSARVLYTFLPHENEQTEIFVSEGETVQLEYEVGTWVFVTSAEGESGYIPADFCVPLTGENSHSTENTTSGSLTTVEPLSSIGKHETIKDTLIGVSQTPEDKPDVYSVEDKISGDSSVGIIEHGSNIYTKFGQLNKVPKEIYIPRESIKRSSSVNVSDPSAEAESVNGETVVATCDICGSYITRLPSQVQGFLKLKRAKADFQSRKLLSETPAYSIQGLLSHLNTDPSVSREQAYSKGINQIELAEKYEPAQNILENLRTNCEQCNTLKNYLQLQGESSMSTVYTNNRDLKLDAASDSDSEGSAERKDDVNAHETPNRVGALMENEHEEHSDGQIESDDNDSPPPLPNSSPPPLIDLTTTSADMEKPDKVEAEVVLGRQTIIINRSPGTRTLPALPKYDSKMAWNDKPLTTPYDQVFNANQTFFDPLLQHMGNPDEDFMRQGSRTTSGFASSEGSVESSEPDKFLGADGKLYDSESDLCVKRVSESSYPSSEEGARPLSGLSDLASPTAISPDGNNVDLLGGFSNSSMSDQDILVPSVKLSNDDVSERTLYTSSSLDEHMISASRNVTSANDAVITTLEPDRNSNGAKSENSHSSKTLPATPKHFDFRANLMVLGNRPKIPALPNKLMVSPALRTRQHTTTAMVSSVNNNKREEEPRTKIRPSIITIAPPMGDRMVVARRQQPATPVRTNADRQDEKDIKKTLHEHSMSPRRTSQMPMRAHHSIHAEAGKDSRPTGRTILVKKHNNQIWRPPTGSPEGSETPRPFSPFGGTLPPSKIGSKKKVVEVFV